MSMEELMCFTNCLVFALLQLDLLKYYGALDAKLHGGGTTVQQDGRRRGILRGKNSCI